jgi:hypothetical protein
MRENKIRIPNFYDYVILYTKEKSTFFYCKLIGGVGSAVDQSKVGGELITFNYFPAEGVNVFLKQ